MVFILGVIILSDNTFVMYLKVVCKPLQLCPCSLTALQCWFMFKRSLMKYTIDQNFDCIELHLDSLFEAAAHFYTIWIIRSSDGHIHHSSPVVSYCSIKTSSRVTCGWYHFPRVSLSNCWVLSYKWRDQDTEFSGASIRACWRVESLQPLSTLL